MRKLISIIIFFILLPNAIALIDCMTIEEMTSRDVPCLLIGTFNYPNNCDTYNITFYNSGGFIIGKTSMEDYPSIGRCVTEFNYTEKDSYFFNISSGDSGRIIVEGGNSMIAIVMAYLIIISICIIIGILNSTKDKKDNEGRAYAIRFISFALAIIELVVLFYIIYANEQGVSLLPILKINFTVLMIGGFGFGIIALVRMTRKLIDPTDEDTGDISKGEDEY